MNNERSGKRTLPEGIAVAVLAVEGLALVFVTVGYGIYAVIGDAPGLSTMLAIFAGVLAVGVLAATWGMWNGKRWSRGLALTWQVMQVAVAMVVWDASPVVGAALVVAAIAVLFGVFKGYGRDVAQGGSDSGAASASGN